MSWPRYDRECECCGADVAYAYHDGAAVAFGLMGMAEAIRNRHAFEVRMQTIDRDIAGEWWRFPGDGSAPYRI